MNFTGEENFAADRDKLWDRLTDMEFVSQAIPDLDRVERMEPDLLVCRVKPSLSFLSGSLKLTFEAIEKKPPDMARIRVSGKGIGASLVVEIEIRLTAKGEETRLAWSADIVERGGLLKPVSPTLIQASAEKVIGAVWSRFREALDG